ncbi:MAG: CpsD/CapB family tyrosine-protein kinase [Anaerolineae bacterium]|nr:CpsD/CapB family tyrosine-protein kinase [Anaerolineae bacterium]
MTTLVTLQDPRSAAAEAFRTLRTNIMFAGLEKPIHTLIVTSPAPEDGKSVTLANLAVTMAQAGHSTVLVDADLRRPMQHTLWNIQNEAGLTSMLLDDAMLENPPLKSVGVENLAVLTSGPLPPNPADLISAKKMETAIDALKSKAEYVLFDAPPVLAVTDTALLASKLDGVLLVMKAGKTRRDYAQQAKVALERIHVRIVGVALTNAPQDGSMNSYYGAKK